MKPNVVVDEMFPEGAGSYMDLDEVSRYSSALLVNIIGLKLILSYNFV